jgi:NADPH2:quinone reductase
MAGTMRAVVVDAPGPPAVLRLREVPVPEPKAGEARLKVAYVGLNPVDAMARAGTLDFLKVSFPFTPGLEHSGVIDAVGPGVSSDLIGRRVISRSSFGGYADYSVAPAAGLIPLDDRIDLKTGCVYRGCAYTAWHVLFLCARLQPREVCVVHSAAGAVGAMLVQIAKEHGATVVALAGGPAKLAYARSFGADAAFDYTTPAWVEEVKAFTGGRGADVIVDGNGGPHFARNYAAVAPLGRIFCIGVVGGGLPDPVPFGLLVGKSISVGGMTLTQVEAAPGSDIDRRIVEAVVSGRWRVPLGETVPLERVADLHGKLEARALLGRGIVAVDSRLR